MSDPEARINAALNRLGEEFRLGMIQPAEYRARRRELFERWADRDMETAPGSVTRRVVRPRAEMAAPPTRSNRPKLIAAGLAGAVIIGGVAYAVSLFSRPAPKPPGPARQPPPVVSVAPPQVVAVKRAADRFLAANRWGEAEINRFLAEWRTLSQKDRALARKEPSIRSLSYEVEQNIRAAEALIPEPGSAEQAHLDRLTAFARELNGEAP